MIRKTGSELFIWDSAVKQNSVFQVMPCNSIWRQQHQTALSNQTYERVMKWGFIFFIISVHGWNDKLQTFCFVQKQMSHLVSSEPAFIHCWNTGPHLTILHTSPPDLLAPKMWACFFILTLAVCFRPSLISHLHLYLNFLAGIPLSHLSLNSCMSSVFFLKPPSDSISPLLETVTTSPFSHCW